MLVITGTQRSGTSLIARALLESGYDLGSSWYDEEVQGGYEDETICAFYREYLGDPTFPFDDLKLPEVGTEVEDFCSLSLEVTKYSYLLMNPAFVSIWHKFRPSGDTFLVMNRNKEHVFESKNRMWERFKHDSLLLRQYPSEMLWNFYTSVLLLGDLGYKYQWLNFPECTSDLDGINRALAALDPNVQIKPEVWERVYDPTKIHFNEGDV